MGAKSNITSISISRLFASLIVAVAPLNPPAQARPTAGVSLILYSEADFRGRSQRFYLSEADLAVAGFAGGARSARLARDGRWMLCTGANYRGRCVTLTTSIDNLDRVGLGHAVASVWRQ